MEIHPITEPIKSLKEFGGHYLLIVLGILTALGLEQWRERRVSARRANEALHAIEAELRGNVQNLRKQHTALAAVENELTAMQERLGGNSFVVPDLAQRAADVVKDRDNEAGFAFSVAALRRSAWDMAIAGSALEHASPHQLVPLAQAYAVIEETISQTRALIPGPRMMELLEIIDAFSRGELSDALQFARCIKELKGMVQMVRGSYLQAADGLERLLAEAPARVR